MKRIFIWAAMLVGIAACTTEKKMESMIDFTNMDTTKCPGTDFYEYATGGWSQKNPLTDEYARYTQFDALREQNREQLIIDEPHGISMAGHHQWVHDIRNFCIGVFQFLAKLTAMMIPHIIQSFIRFFQVGKLRDGLQPGEHMILGIKLLPELPFIGASVFADQC